VSYLLSLLVPVLFIAAVCLFLTVVAKICQQSGTAEFRVNGELKNSEVSLGTSLLEACQEEGIYLPAACGGRGNCGLCKLKLSSGTTKADMFEKIHLGEAALEEGFRLACRSKLRKNTDIAVPLELLNVKKFEAALKSAVKLSTDVKELQFEILGDKMDFKAGQYIQIYYQSNDDKAIRAYSVSSPPSQMEKGLFTLDVKLVDGGLVSTWLHSLKEGSQIDFTGPYGEMTAADKKHKDIILFAGGVGIAPMRSIIREYLEEESKVSKKTSKNKKGKKSQKSQKRLMLYYGAKNLEALYEHNYFLELSSKNNNFIYKPVLSEPRLEDGWEGLTGMIDEHLAEQPVSVSSLILICGPEAMGEKIINLLSQKGVSPENIILDAL